VASIASIVRAFRGFLLKLIYIGLSSGKMGEYSSIHLLRFLEFAEDGERG